MKKTMFSLLFSCLALFSAQAQQNRDYDPFREMEKELQKLMDQLHSGYALDMAPGKDTTFYFKWDTTIQGNGNAQFFFRFNPPNMGFHDDSLGFHDMFKDMDAWSKRMDEQYFKNGRNQQPADDGASPDSGDGLLPEERLRKQDELQEKGGQNVQPPAKPKVRTIRI